ncbi:MAG: Na+:solute symporter [Bacteroidetes bacterium]|nr:Na+:solute symporter [Bacteroidota bacterium]MBU1423944.1 Na+:solute symporter [Bacteroidota bacterium]
MHYFDWSLVALYFLLSLAIGLYYTKRAGSGTKEFFLSGRNLPWWLAGTSMVATTFAADTPLAVTELVAKNGIAGNWLWWNFVFGGMLTVFFFARLWRRAGIMTDVEFVEIRYSGKPAAFLRGFRALYLGLFINCVIIGWVNVAMGSILQGLFGIPESQVILYVAGAMIIVAIYSALSGLWGVAVTDVFQFIIAMVGTTILVFVVLGIPEVGGIAGLKEKLPEWTFNFLPTIGEDKGLGVGSALALSISAFLAYIGIQWWASWYPGAEPGGGGYAAQRMMSAKNEKHSLLATLWFTIAHYCLRPWPWILVGLATLVLYPELTDKKLGYVYAMRDYLPTGLLGLLVAAFFAAYMSTIATHLNWGTSYIINDFYRRFINKEASEKHYVLISRLATIGVMIVSVLLTLVITTISGAWTFIIEAGAGLGLVLILRWYWWRVNAWSEISAMIAPFIAFGYVKVFSNIQFPESLFIIVTFTTVTWLVTTFLTKPTDFEILKIFFERIHPGGFWKPIASRVPNVKQDTGLLSLAFDWFAGIALIYSMLFGIGKLILGEYVLAFTFLAIAVVALWFILWHITKMGWEKVAE